MKPIRKTSVLNKKTLDENIISLICIVAHIMGRAI